MKKQLLFLYLFLISSTLILGQQSYYDDVDLNLTGISLKNALSNKIITTHTNNLSYTPGIWNASKETDVNPDNENEVLLMYGYSSSGTTARTRGINQNGGNSGDWNREHVYPNSRGTPDLDQSGEDGPPYADAHNLRPCDVQTNSSRGNRLFAAGSGNSGAVSGGWYPGDEWKGDVARMMMYMYLRYDSRTLPTNVGVGSSASTPDDMIDLFLQWNAEDPVSQIERQRNDYHGNQSNTYAQGNRNPFIDNPRLATRIWGGPEAEDIWGIYSNSDTEAPSIPMNLVANNITTSSINLSWDASTDNVGVSNYEIFVNGSLEASTSNTSYEISNLSSNTSYSLTVLAADIAENKSAQSSPLVVSTLADTEAPSVPTNITISNETDVSFRVTWNASTDNTAVTAYDIYLDNAFNATTDNTSYTVNGLTALTTYSVTIIARDAVNNESTQSTPVNATTTDGSANSSNEIFISEYIEGSSNNKAIEIANFTGSTVNLSSYNLRRQGNGSGSWSTQYDLFGTLNSGDVVVVINGNADNAILLSESDIAIPNNSDTNFGEPLNFNGNDPVGLFRDDTLIDIIGVFDGGSENFAKDVTLRRKTSVVNPSTIFDLANEWDSFPQDTVDDLGSHSATLSFDDQFFEQVSMYPNPAKDYILLNNLPGKTDLIIYSILGNKVYENTIENQNFRINIKSLKSGIYLIRMTSGNASVAKKIVKTN